MTLKHSPPIKQSNTTTNAGVGEKVQVTHTDVFVIIGTSGASREAPFSVLTSWLAFELRCNDARCRQAAIVKVETIDCRPLSVCYHDQSIFGNLLRLSPLTWYLAFATATDADGNGINSKDMKFNNAFVECLLNQKISSSDKIRMLMLYQQFKKGLSEDDLKKYM